MVLASRAKEDRKERALAFIKEHGGSATFSDLQRVVGSAHIRPLLSLLVGRELVETASHGEDPHYTLKRQ